MSVRVALESPSQPTIAAMIEELDEYQKPLYPAESHHGIDVDALAHPHVLFAVARMADGEAAACAALVLGTDFGELKRMYTRPKFRGLGLGGRLIEFLESTATSRGCREFRLETGYLQVDAIRLYERHGYRRCGPFGSYVDDPNSVFMMKGDA